jgi:hypothetical protein
MASERKKKASRWAKKPTKPLKAHEYLTSAWIKTLPFNILRFRDYFLAIYVERFGTYLLVDMLIRCEHDKPSVLYPRRRERERIRS